jgi:hypothetical protein
MTQFNVIINVDIGVRDIHNTTMISKQWQLILMVLLLKERILRGSDILFGWQQFGVFGELVITFFLDEIMLMLLF